MPDKLALRINNLSKSYQTKSGTLQALDQISLDIPKGSFFGLLGPNGAGKTTMINIIASLVKKTSGSIIINGKDFDKYQTDLKYSLGIVPQELILDPFFTVYETLEIFASYYGIKKSQRKTLEIITALGLKEKAHNPPRSLSGGMRRRLLIAKALVHDPDIIILDEPTAGVDVELREKLWSYVTKLNKQGKTIILTTHYLEEAEELCDHIAIIDKGQIIANDKKVNLKKIFGKKKFIIEFTKLSPQITKILAKFGDISFNKNILTLEHKTNKLSYLDLIASLTKINVEILNITTKESEIEDIFKNLIYNNNSSLNNT